MNLRGTANPGQYLTGKINKATYQLITAYGIAVKNGFEGTEEEWLKSLEVNPEAVAESVDAYLKENPVAVDDTLSKSGEAADAKATGDEIARVDGEISAVREAVASIPGTDPEVSAHVVDKNNPHGVTAEQVGLGNVDNTSDADKPVSTAQAEAIAEVEQKAQEAIDKANAVSLSNLGVTATAAELNYCDGVTSNIQTQLNGKAASSHGTHVSYGTSASALGTSSAGSATTVSRSDHVHALPALTSCTGTLTVAKGGTGSTNGATGLKNLFAAGNTILSSYQYGDSLPTSGFTAGRIFFKKVSS